VEADGLIKSAQHGGGSGFQNRFGIMVNHGRVLKNASASTTATGRAEPGENDSQKTFMKINVGE
jgi:hypothetical protein